MMSCILSSAGSHRLLHSVEIAQERSSGYGREICHKPCNWGWMTDMWVRKLVSWAVAIAPPCLRKQLFPKSAHLALEVLGVPNSVTVDLGELDARDGCILESRIDQ